MIKCETPEWTIYHMKKKWNQHFRCPICSGNNNIINRKRSFRLPDLAEGRLTKQLLTMIPKYSIISFFFRTIQMGSEKKCHLQAHQDGHSQRDKKIKMADCWFHIWQRKSAHANRIKNETTLLGTAFLLCQAIYPTWKKEILWFKLIGRRGHCWFITPYKYNINTGRAGNYQRQINIKLDPFNDSSTLINHDEIFTGYKKQIRNAE